MLVGLPAVLALGTAGLVLGVREIVHRRWLPSGGEGPVYLLLSPNLTLVALAASALIEHGQAPSAAVWLLLTGLFVTVPAIALLPARLPADAPPTGRMQSIASQAQPEEFKERHEEWTGASIGPTRK